MLTIGSRVNERVEELDGVAVFDREAAVLLVSLVILFVLIHIFDPVFFERVFRHHVQDLDFVVRGLLVVRGTFLKFQSHVSVEFGVSSKPYRRKMPPAQLLHDDVPVDHYLTNVHRMVATDLVVRNTLIFTLVAISVQIGLTQVVFESPGSFISLAICSLFLAFASSCVTLLLLVFLPSLSLLLSIILLFPLAILLLISLLRYIILDALNLILVISLTRSVEGRCVGRWCQSHAREGGRRL